MSTSARLGLLLVLIVASGAVHAQAETAPTTPAAPAAGEPISVKGTPVSPQKLAVVLTTVNLFLDQLQSGADAPGYDLLSTESKRQETEEQWNRLFQQIRAKTGARRDSTFGFVLETDNLPNAAKRDYVVVGLNSTFERAKLAETIILTREADRYLITGYHFQSLDEAR